MGMCLKLLNIFCLETLVTCGNFFSRKIERRIFTESGYQKEELRKMR